MWLWLRWPEEIEYDLFAEHRLDIGLWLRLTINPDTQAPYLSSRRMLILIDNLPDKSRVKTAARGGRWPIETQMLSEIANEGLRFRASYHAAHSTKDCDVRFDPEPFYFVDPVVREAREAAAEREGGSAQQAVDDFNAELGFS